jgi:hypothetical protein
MKKRVFSLVTLFVIFLSITSCQKKDDLLYSTVGSIDKVTILDIEPMGDNYTWMVLGRNDDDHDKTKLYYCTIASNALSTKSKRCESKITYNDIEYCNDTLWICGNNMKLHYSLDTGRNISVGGDTTFDFSYFDAYPLEKTDLKKLYVKDGKPFYAIGSKDLLDGNFYCYNNGKNVFKSSQKGFGLNDMVIYNTDEAYVAGYGSIFHVSENGATQKMEDIGDENFTGITINSTCLLTCSYSGTIYRCDLGSEKWEKMTSRGKKLLHIASNSKGDVVVVGETKDILLSTDYGENWTTVKYKEGNKISCLKVINDDFFIGTEKGTIIKLTHDNVALNND